MQTLMDRLEEWCSRWKTKINAGKSSIIHFNPFTSKRREPVIHQTQFEGQLIPQVKEVKYPGITFDHKLEWDVHIKNMIQTAKQQTAILHARLIKTKTLSTSCRQNLYLTLNRPHLTYGAPAWLGAAQAYKRNIYRVERN